MRALNLDEPVQLVDGTPARVLAKDLKGPRSIVIAVPQSDGVEALSSRYVDGRLRLNADTDYDLINVPVRKVWWVNVYEKNQHVFYHTREDADANHTEDRIACLRIEYTKGDGL